MTWRMLLPTGVAIAATAVGGVTERAAPGDHTPAAGDCAPPTDGTCARAAPRRLLLRRTYLGVRCPKANSIACDRVGLAVRPRVSIRRLTASIDGRRFRLAPPLSPDGDWEGTLRPAGLLEPGAALHVTPDRGRFHWEARRRVRAAVRLSGIATDGAPVTAVVTVQVHAGYC